MDKALEQEYLEARTQRDEACRKATDLRVRWLQSLQPGDVVRESGCDEPLTIDNRDNHRILFIKNGRLTPLLLDDVHPWTAEDQRRFEDRARWQKVSAVVKSLAGNVPRNPETLAKLEAALDLKPTT